MVLINKRIKNESISPWITCTLMIITLLFISNQFGVQSSDNLLNDENEIYNNNNLDTNQIYESNVLRDNHSDVTNILNENPYNSVNYKLEGLSFLSFCFIGQ